MSEQNNPQPQQKEIDLLDVTGRIFSGIGRGIQALFGWIKQLVVNCFRLAFKYWWILLLLTILGGALGYFKAKMQKPFFQTEMLVETQIIPRAQIADRINGLQSLIADANKAALAGMLNITVSEAEAIFFIKADVINVRVETPGRRVAAEGESITEELGPQFIRIRVRLWDNDKIEKLEQAILTFIETDPYTQERLAIFRRNNLLQQEAIQTEIEQLRLFQRKNIERSSSVMTAGNTPLMVVNEERTYVGEILELQNQILALQSAFELVRPLSVIQPFFQFENPVDRLLRNVLLYAFLFFTLGYCSLLIREGWKRV